MGKGLKALTDSQRAVSRRQNDDPGPLVEKPTVIDQGSGDNLDDIALAYQQARKDMWTVVAERLGEKWQTLESQVRLTD